MNRSIIIAGVLAGLVPCAAFAQNSSLQNADTDALHMSDVNMVYQPGPASYQPENTDYDLADQGKRFDIECVVGPDGHMRDCEAAQNNLADQNFIRLALGSVKKFVVGPVARDGQPTSGRTFVVTCEFHRTDDAAKRSTDIASLDSLQVAADAAN